VFQHLRHLLEARMGGKGKREFIHVLRLLEAMPRDAVTHAVTQAIQLGAIGLDAVKLIALARTERRPVRLDFAAYPHLPKVDVNDVGGRLCGAGGMSGTTDAIPTGTMGDTPAGAARPSPEAAEAADSPARIRQGRA